MQSEQDLINKLLISKKIMDKHNGMGRGQARDLPQTPTLESFEPVNAKYNLPTEMINEAPVERNYATELPTEDRILNSKLPDEIKRLMIEHPIEQPKNNLTGGAEISADLVERASRLMKKDILGEQASTQPTQRTVVQPQNSDIRQIVRETIEDVLRENGLLTESESKSNDQFKFRVGQHIFEGRVTKIKKIAK